MSDEKSQAAPVGPERYFQDRLDEGRFMIQRSRTAGAHVFYPRVRCPLTGADDLEWVEPSGLGTVYSTTMVMAPRGSSEVGYNIALVDLLEGPRMLTRVIDISPDKVQIGMPVRAKIGKIDGKSVVLFAPVQGAT
jgi:hypothetical protein